MRARAGGVGGAGRVAEAGLRAVEWTLVFGGKTASGSTDVQVDFGAGAPAYSNVGTVTLDAVDTAFAVPLGSTADSSVFVRLRLDPMADAFIDNVMIQVPEPGEWAAASSALSALCLCAAMRRLRRV